MMQTLFQLLLCLILGTGCMAPYQPTKQVNDPWGRPIVTRDGPLTYATVERGQPVVVFSSQRWGWHPQPVQDFVWHHEVAHHQLGHVAIPESHGRDAEAAADCEAIRATDPDPDALLPILNSLQSLTSDRNHAPGEERAAHVLTCWAWGRGARW